MEHTVTKKLDRAQGSFAEYDLIGKIAEATTLTRRSAAAILAGMKQDKLWLFRENPEEFITKVADIINHQKAAVVVEHITYTPSAEEPYSQDIFNMSVLLMNMLKPLKQNMPYKIMFLQKEQQQIVLKDGLLKIWIVRMK